MSELPKKPDLQIKASTSKASSSSSDSLHSTVSNHDNLEDVKSCIETFDSLNIASTSAETADTKSNASAISDDHDKSSIVSFDEDYSNNEAWLAKKKHVFILSSAGKPIFSRYGSENKLATLFGIMQALVSFVIDQGDSIQCINAGDTRFVFMVENHLILVAVSKTGESEEQLRLLLNYAYSQIISILTTTTLNKTYEKRGNFDLRRSLSGVERLLDHLLDFYDKEPAFLIGGVQCLPLQQTIRDSISCAIIQACKKIKNVVFAVLIANNRLITMVKMKNYTIHPCDLHLILNLVQASESLKAAESWTPLCLPRFRDDGYLYTHISYLAADCQACLLLFTTDRDVFFELSEAKAKIVEKLRRGNCLEQINEALITPDATSVSAGFLDVRHYLYKAKSTDQFWQPAIAPPYNKDPQQLLDIYRRTKGLMDNPERVLKLIYDRTTDEAVLGWDTKEFVIYVVFEPLISTPTAISTVSKLLTWLKKKEDRLFEVTPHYF